MNMIDRPSPNFDDRPDGRAPDMIVIHYTGMEGREEALQRLCDPEPADGTGRVSAHYTIDTNGDMYTHVHPDKRAWHAGVSFWRGREGLNDYAIGIELVNSGHEFGYHEYAAPQMQALITLMRKLHEDYLIPLEHVVGHQDIAPMRKRDPGYLFPWRQLARQGLALMPTMLDVADAEYRASEEDIRFMMKEIGYNTDESIKLPYLIRAFHARFAGHEKEEIKPETWPVLHAAAKIFALADEA